MLKNIVRKIDNKFFAGAILERYRNYMAAKAQARLASTLDYRMVSYYAKNPTCEISRLCDLYGSDKGELRKDGHPYPWPSHTYADFYARLFSHCRNGVKLVFECGLGTNNPELPSSMGASGKPGASLRVWRDYFPNARIYGADIDRDILFEEDRIQTFYIDQLDPVAIKDYWGKVGTKDFDFMIDDGLHTFQAGTTLFLHSIDKLAENGVYIIEDVGSADLLLYLDFFRDKNFAVEFICLHRPSSGLVDNSLISIRRQN